ncbi:MAG: hypothetical protein ABSG70_14650 [Terriglobales bacterium]|jgi:hypothetical protein
MKVLGLFVLLFFFCCMPLARAQESSAAKTDQAMIEASPFKADRIILNLNSELLPPGPVSYCAFMRTYRVKRDQAGSDAVSPAGYTTCVPSKRFEVKSAVETSREPVRDRSSNK